jgi:RNA polymerase sigma-70 factor (ECF subfamily)
VALPEESDGTVSTLLSAGGTADAASEFDAKEQSAALHRAILALPQHYREAVVLCDLEEMSYAEAAMAAGCSVGTMRSRLNRGRTMLAKKMRRTEAAPAAAQGDPAGCMP